jgi:hypothetical protein
MVAHQAIHTFVAEHGDELGFDIGDVIEILEKDDSYGDGWWRVSISKAHCCLTCRIYLPFIGSYRARSRRSLSSNLCLGYSFEPKGVVEL